MKINWIEFGLPWYVSDLAPDEELQSLLPTYPREQLAPIVREKFGTTYEEIDEKIESIPEKKKSRLMLKFNELQKKFDYEKERKELIDLTDDKELKKYLNMIQLRADINAFEVETDIFKNYRKKDNQIRAEYFKSRPKKSFRPDLAKPGTLIELQSGKRMIIGHINALGGVCDDCSGINDEDIVVRYAVIYNGDE